MDKFERIEITAPVLFDNFRLHTPTPPHVTGRMRAFVTRMLKRLLRLGRHHG